MKSFASDNYSGVHPQVFKALADANSGHAMAYGADYWTARAEEKIRDIFGPDASAFFVFNGTGGNVTALQSLLRPFDAVICSQQAHIHQDECGAPERITGAKLLDLPVHGGKLKPEQFLPFRDWVGDQHKTQPRVLSVTQSTEKGTVYTLSELRALAEAAKPFKMSAHLDGARFANAVASLGVKPRAIVDALQARALVLGGTKNGLLAAEAVVTFDGEIAERMRFVRKQNMQLASKQRFLSAQFLAYFDFWLETAAHANAMAGLLAAELGKIPEIRITESVDANAVFAILPAKVIAPLQKEYPFYVWDSATREVRLMASFDTTAEDVNAFIGRLKSLLT